jgi:hypothetical protein
MKAYVLIAADETVDPQRLVRQVARLPGVESVEPTRGAFDLIAEVMIGSVASLALNTIPCIDELAMVRKVLPLVVDDGSDQELGIAGHSISHRRRTATGRSRDRVARTAPVLRLVPDPPR